MTRDPWLLRVSKTQCSLRTAALWIEPGSIERAFDQFAEGAEKLEEPKAAAGPGANAGGVRAMDGLVSAPARIICLKAVGPDGSQQDLTDRIRDGRLEWTAPGAGWILYSLSADYTHIATLLLRENFRLEEAVH